MNKKITKLMAAIALLVFMMPSLAGWGQTRTYYDAVITFDCASASANGNSTIYGGSASTSMGPTHIKAFLNNAAGSTVINSNPSSYSSVYWAKGSGGPGIPDDVLKIGTASGSGNCTFTIADSFDEISKVSITGYGWKNTTKVAVNGSATQSPSAAATKVTFDYVLSEPTRTIAINITTSAFCATEIVLYKEATSSVCAVTYDCNGGESNCPSNLTDIEPGTSITLASAPTKPHYNFIGWKNGGTTYDAGASYTVNSNVTFIAQWEPDGTYGEGSICFSNQSSCTAINSQSVTGEDDLGNTWTITTVGTSSFISNSGYYQVGSGNSPASSITFTTTLDEEVNVVDFSATFGGFNATRASVVLKVDNTQVGSGTLNGGDDVTVSSSSAQIGTTLTVIVTPTAGGVKCYNISYAYETIDNPAVATTTTINVPQDFNTDIYQGTTAGTLTATVKDKENNTISGATVTWSSSNTDVATIDANGAVTLVAVGTTTITANYAGVADQYRPSTGTYELTVTDSNAPGTQNNPYTVAQAIAATPSSGTSDNVYIHGIVSRFHNTSIVGDGTNYRYYISDDGTTSNELLVYKGKGLNNVDFSDANDLLKGDVVTICGGLTTYSGTKEVAAGNYIVSLVRPAQYTLTNAMTNVHEYRVFVGEEEIEFDANNQVQVTEGKTVYVSLTMEDCYSLTSLTVNGSTTGVTEIEPGVYYSFVMPEGDATIGVSATQATQYTLTVVGGENVSFDLIVGSATTPAQITNGTVSICEQLYVIIDNLTVETGLILESITLTYGNTTEEINPAVGFAMPASNATLTFTTHEAETFTYTKVNSVTPGKHYIIVSVASSNKYYAMGGKNANGSYMNPIEVSVDDNTVTVAESEGVAEILIAGTEGNYTLHTSEGYLAGGSKSLNNNGTESSKWSISFNASNQAEISWGSTEYKIQYNASNPRFACYNTNQVKVCLYEKNESTIPSLPITGYDNGGGWNLIASPVSIDPVVAGMITDEEGSAVTTETGSYDLYRFNQSADKEWENYRANSFNLVPGTGYLYANKNDVTIQFAGTPSNNGEVTLVYDAGKVFAGWNLIGNPFAVAATLNMPYYRMNENQTTLGAEIEEGQIAAMEGVFVYAYDTENEQAIETATFTRASRSNNAPQGFVNLNVEQNASVIDNVIVRFDEGRSLPKLNLFEGSAKLYITENGKDYAITRAAAQGEMPVNFKAAENGTYTLTVNPEAVELNYLHLIDNMTGMDIDLLANPSYTFDAKTTDYESRFRLVFAANNEDGVSTGSTTFAFFSNGNWIVSNEGEATLQVIDLNGRIVSSETINGTVATSLTTTPGIYMLRLVNGNEVKTQKVVVK